MEIFVVKDGGFKIYKNVLYIWFWGEDMFIVLFNLDGSFIVILFLFYLNSDYCFDNLIIVEKVEEYF